MSSAVMMLLHPGRRGAVGTTLTDGLLVAYDFHETSGDYQDLLGGTHPLARNATTQIPGIFGKAARGMEAPFDATLQQLSGGTDSIWNQTPNASWSYAMLTCMVEFSSAGSNKGISSTYGNTVEYFLLVDTDSFQLRIADGDSEWSSGVAVSTYPTRTGWYGWLGLVVFYYDAVAKTIGISIDGSDYVIGDVSAITVKDQANSKFGVMGGWDYAAFNTCITVHQLAKWDRVLTHDEVVELYNGGRYLNYPFVNETVDNSYKLVFDGDSFAKRMSYPLMTLQLCGRGHPFAVYAVGGENMTQVLARGAATDAGYDAACAQNILLLTCGHNDLHQNRSAADIYADMVTYVTARQAAGYEVIVATVCPSDSDITGAQETARQSLNALILTNTAGADATIDPGADATLATSADNIYYCHDHIHLTQRGDAYLAGLAYTAIAGLI